MVLTRPPVDAGAVQRRTLRTLIVSQVLGGVGVAVGLAVGALLAEDLSGSTTLAGLATTAAVLGSAVAAVPLARLMAARGRRPGLALGYLIGAAGAGVVVLAAVADAYWLLLAGLCLFGVATAANMQARYAATDLAEPAHRGRALATVVWATTIGAVAGPNLSGPAGGTAVAANLPEFAGPFMWSGLAFLLAGAVVALLLRPDPLLTARAGQPSAGPVPAVSLRASLDVIRRHPRALVGLAAIAVSHLVMISVMTLTPVHMHHGGAQLRLVGLVFSVHVAGMYALSPVVGWAADRFGRAAGTARRPGGARRRARTGREGRCGLLGRPDRRAVPARPRLVRRPGVRVDAAHRVRTGSRQARGTGRGGHGHGARGRVRRRDGRSGGGLGRVRRSQRGRVRARGGAGHVHLVRAARTGREHQRVRSRRPVALSPGIRRRRGMIGWKPWRPRQFPMPCVSAQTSNRCSAIVHRGETPPVIHRCWSASPSCRRQRLASSPMKRTRRPPEVAPMAGQDRDKALDTALAQIERQFGKGSVMRLGDDARAPVEVIPTGSIALDVALGIGGLPRGRIVEVYGPEASGKTTVALHAVANAQRAGGIAGVHRRRARARPRVRQASSVSTPTHCWSPSPTPASRRWRSPTC